MPKHFALQMEKTTRYTNDVKEKVHCLRLKELWELSNSRYNQLMNVQLPLCVFNENIFQEPPMLYNPNFRGLYQRLDWVFHNKRMEWGIIGKSNTPEVSHYLADEHWVMDDDANITYVFFIYSSNKNLRRSFIRKLYDGHIRHLDSSKLEPIIWATFK